VSADDLAPARAWEPQPNERVCRRSEPARMGTVVNCNRFGHVADPYWLVTVRWDDGGFTHGVETSLLVREDGTQGPA